jgi:spore coat protein CotH
MAKTILKGHVDPGALDTGLPVITITTRGGLPVTSKEVYLDGEIEIRDPHTEEYNLKAPVQIRGRGNSSWPPPKKPYRLKFPRKTALLGYEKAKSWVLLANYRDTTLLLNCIASELGRRFGLPFTPHYTHVELVMNGSYEGSYVLTGHIQTGKGRVDIDEDGGFLAELDTRYDEEPRFRTPLLDLPVMIKHPEDLEDSGYDFVKKALFDLEEALFSDTFPDRYRDLIDLDTFVDYIMINEITRNADIQRPNSVFLYRDKDSRICLGPLWDFDNGFGYNEVKFFTNIEGMYHNTRFYEWPKKPRGGDQGPHLFGQRFFSRFFEDPAFRKAYRERWNTVYPELVRMDGFIDAMAVFLEKSYRANVAVWKWKKVNYPKEIARLKEWWTNRIAYLHREINTF